MIWGVLKNSVVLSNLCLMPVSTAALAIKTLSLGAKVAAQRQAVAT